MSFLLVFMGIFALLVLLSIPILGGLILIKVCFAKKDYSTPQGCANRLDVLARYNLYVGITHVFFGLFIACQLILTAMDSKVSPISKLANISNEPGVQMIVIGYFFFCTIILLAYGFFPILSSRFMKNRKHRMASIVITCCTLLACPLGTLIGIMTIIDLSKRPIEDLYLKNAEG